MNLSRRCLLLGTAAAWGDPATAAAVPWTLQALPAPEPLQQLHSAAGSGWLAIGASGRLWALGSDMPPHVLANGLDGATPLAVGHGRIVARRTDGRLWVGGGAADAGESNTSIAAHAGLLVLPLAVIAVEGQGLHARVLRLEPGTAGRWQVVARSGDTVLPDARPLQVDLDGRADGGQVLVLAGPDDQRYGHTVLGDGIEATRVLLLERHGLQPLRRLELPAPQVLEDIAPRVWHGGGAPGLVSMLSDAEGARLVLIQADPARADRLAITARGEPIGTRNRWMAASTDGQRLVAVHMPHLSGVLTVYRRSGERLVARTLAGGVSNHAIGTRELDVSAWLDGLFIVPDKASRQLRRFDVDASLELAPVPCPGPVTQIVVDARRTALACLCGDGRAYRSVQA